jgi:hypothetical protein
MSKRSTNSQQLELDFYGQKTGVLFDKLWAARMGCTVGEYIRMYNEEVRGQQNLPLGPAEAGLFFR